MLSRTWYTFWILVAILIGVIVISTSQPSDAAEGKRKPIVSMQKIAKKMKCQPDTVEITYDYHDSYNYKSLECLVKGSGEKVYAENYFTKRLQGIDIGGWEFFAELSVPYDMAVCRGYNVISYKYTGNDRADNRWVRQYARKHNCDIRRIDADIFTRKGL